MSREALSQCLELLAGTLPYLKTNVESRGGSDWTKELSMIGAKDFLRTNHR